MTRLAGDKRRLVLVSMPCDSPGAALVALGALRWRMSQENADDLHSHLERLRQLGRRGATDVVLRHDVHKGRFLFDKVDAAGRVWVRRDTGKASSHKPPLRMAILPERATSWTFGGEPPVQVIDGDEIPYRPIYNRLVEGLDACLDSNLKRSDSGVCLAGRMMGAAASRAVASSIRLRSDGCDVGLDQLLTVHAWLPNRVSRVTFFNSRMAQLDRPASRPLVVAADGDHAFLTAWDNHAFRHSDVVGVMHRTIERDRLEAIAVKLAHLKQWYVADTTLVEALEAPPHGISFISLKHGS
ncbi:MAG: hypothetical protein AB7T37_03930 [Dehalococcoidia bacterium]